MSLSTNNIETIKNEKKELEENTENIPYSSFSRKRKFIIISIITGAGFLGPVTGNIYIPVLPLFKDVYGVSDTEINGTVSIFMAVFAFAPMLWASWADYSGRKTLYLISLLFYIGSNILLSVLPPKISILYVLRCFQAFGASCVMSVGAGTITDIIKPSNRAKVISYFMLGPQLGPILGPILSLIATAGSWRWIFGFLAIAGAFVYILILFFLPETLRFLVGNGECYNDKGLFLKPKLIQRRVIDESSNFPRPLKPGIKTYWMLLKYPPVLICSINSSLLFASYYALNVTLANILQTQYHLTFLQCCLSYLCPGVALIIGSISGGKVSDSMRKRAINKNPDKYVPEHRVLLQLFGLVCSITGIMGYGWTVDKNLHLASVFVFVFMLALGITWVFITSTTYLTECPTGHPASNVAISNLLRNLAAAISSVIVNPLINAMGFGNCFTGYSLINLISMVLVAVMLKYGSKWRCEAKSKNRK